MIKASEKIIIPLIFLFMSSACSSHPGSTLTDNLCEAPCWRGIEPGKTSSSDALSVVRSFADTNQNSISISDPWNIFSGLVYFQLKPGKVVRIFSINDTVALITFESIEGEVTFNDFISAIGTPTYVYHTMVLGPGFPLLPASDADHPWLYAIYPSRGVSFGSDMYNVWLGPTYSFRESSKITEIQYFDPEEYDLLLEKGFVVSISSGFSPSDLYSWKGYGNLNELYPLQ